MFNFMQIYPFYNLKIKLKKNIFVSDTYSQEKTDNKMKLSQKNIIKYVKII